MRCPLALVVAIAGCGGDGVSVDAMPRPDATPPDLSCKDDAPATTAIDPIVIRGHAYNASPLGQTDLAGARVETVPAGGLTTSGADGLFAMTVANPSLTPIDGYVLGTADGFVDTYLYPPAPLAADPPEAPLLFVTADTLEQIAFTSGVNQSPSLGFLGVLVQDCAALPITGATVTVDPPSDEPSFDTTVVYVSATNFPDVAADATGGNGLAYVFNVPLGTVTVDAELGDLSLREHPVTSRSGVLTTTAVGP